MVNWIRCKKEELKSRLKTVQVEGKEILQMMGNPYENERKIRIIPNNDDVPAFDIDARSIVQPIGKIGKMAIKSGQLDLFERLVKLSWVNSGNANPMFMFDLYDDGKDAITVRQKCRFTEEDTSKDLPSLLEETKMYDNHNFDDIVLGNDGEKIELQFLSNVQNGQCEVRAGDVLQAGIFVSINGRVKVSAGVNRLVCTNGLIKRMDLWTVNSLNGILDESIFNQGIELMEWFRKTADQKVKSIRELSCILDGKFPKGLMTRKWKEWSERVELGDLTIYDVINDMTFEMNRTLGSARYNVLGIGNRIKEFEQMGKCPTCSAKV